MRWFPLTVRLCRPCVVRLLCVTLVFSNKGQRYLRIGLAVPLFGSVACLRRMVADEGNISPDQVTGAAAAVLPLQVLLPADKCKVCVCVCVLQVILTEVYSTGFQRSFFDEEDLTSISDSDVIYAFQAPPLYIRGGSARVSGRWSDASDDHISSFALCI